jgi:hypothetical protein
VTCPTDIIQGVGEAKTRHPSPLGSRLPRDLSCGVRGCCELSRCAARRAQLQCRATPQCSEGRISGSWRLESPPGDAALCLNPLTGDAL